MISHEAIKEMVIKMQEYEQSPEGQASYKRMQESYQKRFFSDKEIKYAENEDGKHIIYVPPSQHKHFYNGEDLKPEIKEWLDENLTWNIRALDDLVDVWFIFDSEEDAMAFKMMWCCVD